MQEPSTQDIRSRNKISDFALHLRVKNIMKYARGSAL
jgi:hypothetical protein